MSSKKDKELKKVLSEVKGSMKEDEYENLRDNVLAKLNENSTLADLMQDPSVHQTLQGLLQNENIANLLKKSDFKKQLSNILSTKDKEGLVQQFREVLAKDNFEKKD